jgi:hypothetical protein
MTSFCDAFRSVIFLGKPEWPAETANGAKWRLAGQPAHVLPAGFAAVNGKLIDLPSGKRGQSAHPVELSSGYAR